MAFNSEELIDSFTTLEAGVNQGISPLLLQKNQMSRSLNLTVRGTFAHPRPPWRKITLDYSGDTTLQSIVESPRWQKGCFYKPDSGLECLMAAIAGRLFQFEINGITATVSDVTGVVALDPNQTQAWLWQAEKWIVFEDGINNPLFYTSTLPNTTPNTTSKTVQSTFGTLVNFSTTTADPITIPGIGSSVSAITFTDVTNLVVGDIVTIRNRGTWQVLAISGSDVDLLNLTASPVGFVIATSSTVSWSHGGTQLPPGRMGTYGMGRNWVCLVDGKQFVGSDAVGGSSGTVDNNYRDAVLYVTENLYLAGGGNFTVPGSIGDIHFMKFTATLDTSLGQGPLQVGVPDSVFSVNSPVDRLTWQDTTNPILTESLISNGGLSQESTVNANSDLIMRSVDGIVSLILARREDNTWGIVPISREVSETLSQDNPALLIFGSAEVFDNRLLMTARPVATIHGVYHRALIALNFDPISSLRGKAPSVYDGVWSGPNILQIITGLVQQVDRCFAFTLNTFTDKLELLELLPSATTEIYDYGDPDAGRIVQSMESASLFNYPKENELSKTLKRLLDGEIQVDNLRGNVHFEVLYKPDQWPCWVPWFEWDECSTNTDNTTKPGFRPRMGFGEPSMRDCDPYTNRVLREAYTFQVKVIITGQCEVLAVRVKSVTVPETPFAKQVCDPICQS